MDNVIKLLYITGLPVLTTVILYLITKKTRFDKLDYKVKQAIYGLFFGAVAVFSSEFGVDVGGAIINTRDASVLTAGLVFGSPAGIIAGLIGGIERFFAVYWGGGVYTRIGCSLSTLIAGLFGAALRRHMFDNKKPSITYALVVGLVMEVFHMLMIFITNMSDISTAFVFVKKCSITMITANGIAVTLSVLVVILLGKERSFYKNRRRQIAVVAQRWLLNCVVAAFLITCIFNSVLQIQIADKNTDDLLELNINDVVSEISDASDRNILNVTQTVMSEFSAGNVLSAIAEKYGITEINIVDENGVITDSTNSDYIGYEMSSGEQSAEFLVLLDDQESFVQRYQPISYNNSILRKYAGVALPDGGFVQVGYDALNFQQDIAREVINAAANRHVGRGGYLLIVDANNKIVSSGNSGKYLSDTGLNIDKSIPDGTRFTATVFGEKSYCMYRVNEGYAVISVYPEDEAIFSRDLSIYIMAFMEIVLFAGLFILTYFLIKKLVVDNIKSVNNSLAEITGGNLNVVVNVRSNEEFASLSDDINATVDTLKQYIAEAAARIDRELELAKVIQESSLPSVFPPFPERKELDIYASMCAAKEVGGDFYDFYMLDDDHLAFLVADVSGKGITAAMFMMKAKALIKGFAEHAGDVAEILTMANNALCDGNDAEMFVTCFIGILDLKNGKIDFSNAGHNPPLIRTKDGKFEYFKSRPGFVLAGMEGINYRKGEIEFNPGDTIFLYTDGVTEATNSTEQLYGDERLLEMLNTCDAASAEDICRSVRADVDSFVGAAPQFDDITMLCIKTDIMR